MGCIQVRRIRGIEWIGRWAYGKNLSVTERAADLAPFVADINDVLRLLKVSGRQLAIAFGASRALVSNWARGAAAPIASTRWLFARLAMRLRAASPEQLAGWSAELVALDADDGSAFDLILELAGGALDLRPRSTVAPRPMRRPRARPLPHPAPRRGEVVTH